jgi:uncharacterized protein YegP (UPF0339 family)
MHFELYRQLTLAGKKWAWRLRAENGEIIARGESYSRKIDAERAIEIVQASAIAEVEEK